MPWVGKMKKIGKKEIFCPKSLVVSNIHRTFALAIRKYTIAYCFRVGFLLTLFFVYIPCARGGGPLESHNN